MQKIIEQAVKSGIIDLTDIADRLEQMNRENIISQYHIWQGKNGSWYTKINGRLVKKNERRKIEDSIIKFHNATDESINGIFNQYIIFKRRHLQPSTIIRYTTVFNTYFKAIKDRDIKTVTAWDIEEFITDILDDGITAKEFGNIRTVMFGIFKMARKKNLIDFRITEVIEDMNISPKFFKRKAIRKQILDNDEYNKTIEYLTTHRDQINLGLLLILLTGLRIGELCGLYTKNVHIKEGYIEVTSMEIRTENDYVIVDKTKTESSRRKVYLASKHIWVLKELKKAALFKEFLFTTEEGQIKSYTFRKRWYQICDELNIERIGLHKLRKTYASRLLQNGADKSLIVSQLGHTDFNTTIRHYIRDVETDNEKRLAIQKVT